MVDGEPALSTPGRRLRRWGPAAVVVLALVLRIAVVAADTGYRPTDDAFEYDHYGRTIAAGEGFGRSGYLRQGGPTAIRGPAYPYALGALYAASGDSRTVGRLFNALLGALAVFLLYLIARRLWGDAVGLIAAALAAVFPPLVLLSRDLVSESLFIAIELGAVLCVLNFRRSGGRLRWALAAGALCGVAVLTRNTGIALLVPIAIGLWVPAGGRAWAALAAPLVALACATLLVTPWLVRDWAQFDRFVPVTTSGGIALAGTYNQTSFDQGHTHGAWRDPQVVPGLRHLFEEPGRDEAEVDRILRSRALSFAWEHPGYVAETSAWNLLRLFEIAGGSVVDARGAALDARGIGSGDPAAERIGLALACLLAAIGVAVLVRARLRARAGGTAPHPPSGPLFLWLVPLAMLAIAIPIAGLPRYRLPADPFLLMLAAIGIQWLLHAARPATREAR
ncbi:MAG: glycosyltransferase family 39 protein [Solirubrobacterales bacterium]